MGWQVHYWPCFQCCCTSHAGFLGASSILHAVHWFKMFDSFLGFGRDFGLWGCWEGDFDLCRCWYGFGRGSSLSLPLPLLPYHLHHCHQHQYYYYSYPSCDCHLTHTLDYLLKQLPTHGQSSSLLLLGSWSYLRFLTSQPSATSMSPLSIAVRSHSGENSHRT